MHGLVDNLGADTRRPGPGVDHGKPSGGRENGLGRAVSRDDPEEHPVREGDEIAVFPPVTGG